MDDEISVPAPRRGWSSQGLQVVATNDKRYWSIYDATIILGEPFDEKRVAMLIKLADLKPAGKRHNGSRRRHVRVYLAADILNAHEKAAALMGIGD